MGSSSSRAGVLGLSRYERVACLTNNVTRVFDFSEIEDASRNSPQSAVCVGLPVSCKNWPPRKATPSLDFGR